MLNEQNRNTLDVPQNITRQERLRFLEESDCSRYCILSLEKTPRPSDVQYLSSSCIENNYFLRAYDVKETASCREEREVTGKLSSWFMQQ